MHCGQIMLLLSIELREEDEPMLIRAMGGVSSGMFSGLNCGTLTGGACLIASYCAASAPAESDKYNYSGMVAELVEWFRNEFGAVDCTELVGSNPSAKALVCPPIIEKTFIKCIDLLEQNGIDPRE